MVRVPGPEGVEEREEVRRIGWTKGGTRGFYEIGVPGHRVFRTPQLGHVLRAGCRKLLAAP